MTPTPFATALRGLVEAFGQGEPWSLLETLSKLVGAAEHLLGDHACDAHGWEGVDQAAKAGRRHIEAIRAALAAWESRGPMWEERALRDVVAQFVPFESPSVVGATTTGILIALDRALAGERGPGQTTKGESHGA